MDLEKVKSNYKWDPSRGDYPKGYISYERRINKKKQLKRFFFVSLYVILLIASIILVYMKIK
jgi:hypothetical protein